MKKILVLLLILSTSLLYSQTVEEIVKKLDKNVTFASFEGKGRIIIEGKYGTRESRYIVYAKGEHNSLIEFISGEEEGQKIFKTPDDLYIWYPYAEEVQRLSRKKTLGAVSYDEMSGEKNTLKNYKVTLLAEEMIGDREVYKLQFIAKSSKVAHYKQEVYVDKEDFIALKVLYYSKSGKLTKEMLVKKTDVIGGYVVATHQIITDKLKKNNSTETIMDEMEIDVELDDDIFSLGELSW